MEEKEVVCTVQCDLVRYGTVWCGVVRCSVMTPRDQCTRTHRTPCDVCPVWHRCRRSSLTARGICLGNDMATRRW